MSRFHTQVRAQFRPAGALATCDTLLAAYHRQVQQQVFTRRGYRALLMPTLANAVRPR